MSNYVVPLPGDIHIIITSRCLYCDHSFATDDPNAPELEICPNCGQHPYIGRWRNQDGSWGSTYKSDPLKKT